MKWTLVKLLCIVGTGVLGAVLFGDAVAGVVVAPFGWIVGKAVELHATAKKMGITGYRTAVAEGSEEEWEDDYIGFWKPGDAMDMALNPCNPWYDVDDE